jgi:protein SCO1
MLPMLNRRRRQLVQGMVASLALPALSPARAHVGMGPVRPPLAAPTWPLTLSTGASQRLPALLKNHVTALQLMFTGCSASCPIQGAVFADVQQSLQQEAQAADWRLLSVSIDALNDGAAQLTTWLKRFSARPERWRAAVPAVSDVDALFDFLQGRSNNLDRHTAQVFVFNRRGELAFRTVDFASSKQILVAMQQVAGT